MDNTNQLFREKEKLNHYERVAEFKEKENEMFSYKELNTRYINLEKTYDKNEYAQHEKTRQANKKAIESQWHSQTDTEAKKLKEKKGNRTETEYYESFRMADLETLLKNSDRGGNSGLFNDVVTDLELLNRVGEKISQDEVLTLTLRLESSCKKYLSTRKKPFSTEGKIRRAIIEQVSRKLQYTSQSLKTNYKTANEELNSDEKSINKAVKANYDLISQYLQGNAELTKEEMDTLDNDMVRAMEKMVSHTQVDENQNNSISSRFFNILGWTSRTPRIVSETKIDEEYSKGPISRPMFQTINTYNKINAIPAAKQLLGIGENSRHYMSNGVIGKGTYLAAAKEWEYEERAKNNSWTYGTSKGSIQLRIALNEKTRMITDEELGDLLNNELKVKFPKLMDYMTENETGTRGGQEWLSMAAALLGYNTIRGTSKMMNVGDGSAIEYLVSFDRSAMSICSTVEILTVENGNYEDMDNLNIEDFDKHING